MTDDDILKQAPPEATHFTLIDPNDLKIPNYLDLRKGKWYCSEAKEWKHGTGCLDEHIRSIADIKQICAFKNSHRRAGSLIRNYLETQQDDNPSL
jgi:hypothetical protein